MGIVCVMLLSSILATVLCIIQFGACKDLSGTNTKWQAKNNVKPYISNKEHMALLNEAKSFENIQEDANKAIVKRPASTTEAPANNELIEIKALLSKLTNKINTLEKANGVRSSTGKLKPI